jgi:hypothetical protein
LDGQGLLALWRQGLLALNVLSGSARGYKNHPQLDRFKAHKDPIGAITAYLQAVKDEMINRGYRPNLDKLAPIYSAKPIPVKFGQIEFEFEHLRKKVCARSPGFWPSEFMVELHPMFVVTVGKVGDIEDWERGE